MLRLLMLAVVVGVAGCHSRSEDTRGDERVTKVSVDMEDGRKLELAPAKGAAVPAAVPGPPASDVAKIGHITVKATPDIQKQYMFLLQISSDDPTKNTQFEAWSKNFTDLPPAKDDLGNSYLPQLVPFEHLSAFFPRYGRLGAGSITSAISRCDAVKYQPLVPKAKKMIFSLPAANLGETGMLQFEFTADRFKGPS